MAKYMYVNVRWGGSPYWMTPYRWGYGWNYWEGMKPRGYQRPSAEQQTQIDALLPAALAAQMEDARTNPPALSAPASSGSTSHPSSAGASSPSASSP